MTCFQNKISGFTLAELLLALVILGVIATFTIPKVLTSQQDAQKKAIAKEAAGWVSDAYIAYKGRNTVTATTGMDDFTQFLNYVKRETTGSADHRPDGNGNMWGAGTCSDVNATCYRLHNGAIIWWYTGFYDFGGTAPGDNLFFCVDPDGAYQGTTNGAAVEYFLYTTGRITTRGSAVGDKDFDPTWFNWN